MSEVTRFSSLGGAAAQSSRIRNITQTCMEEPKQYFGGDFDEGTTK